MRENGLSLSCQENVRRRQYTDAMSLRSSLWTKTEASGCGASAPEWEATRSGSATPRDGLGASMTGRGASAPTASPGPVSV